MYAIHPAPTLCAILRAFYGYHGPLPIIGHPLTVVDVDLGCTATVERLSKDRYRITA